jgi:hypothetical protein
VPIGTLSACEKLRDLNSKLHVAVMALGGLEDQERRLLMPFTAKARLHPPTCLMQERKAGA